MQQPKLASYMRLHVKEVSYFCKPLLDSPHGFKTTYVLFVRGP